MNYPALLSHKFGRLTSIHWTLTVPEVIRVPF